MDRACIKKIKFFARVAIFSALFAVALASAADAAVEFRQFVTDAGLCQVILTEKEGGSYDVLINVPFDAGVEPSTFARVGAAFRNVTITNLSYAYENRRDGVVPITAYRGESAARATMTEPHLRISGTMRSSAPADIAVGLLASIQFKRRGDAADYVQTFPQGGLMLKDMPTTIDNRPLPDSDSSNCDAGAGTFALLVLAAAAALRRK